MARRLLAECFGCLQIRVQTRWGLSAPIAPNRGRPQGASSSPEASKPAQEPILRLRETSTAAYITSMGRRVEAFAYVDDGEHYWQGMRDLQTIINELGVSSHATGIGFAWSKFSAYSTGWDTALDGHGGDMEGVHADRIEARGWNIWGGGLCPAAIPRSNLDDVEKLLGKRGTITDKHSLAAADTLVKIAKIRKGLMARRCSWDEISEALQVIVQGVLCYAPLVGTPSPSALHVEDQAFQRMVLQDMRVRNTVESASLLAPVSAGGVQCPSLIECNVTAVARDLLILLCGSTPCAQLARDALRQSMQGAPPRDAKQGLVARACDFLAGYGLYVTCSTDRCVSRILDALQTEERIHGHTLQGRFSHTAFACSRKFSRVGELAICVRRAVAGLRSAGIPASEWHVHPEQWSQHISEACGVPLQQIIAAAAIAYRHSQQDWATEVAIFSPGSAPVIAEDWEAVAWEQPWAPRADPRSRWLDRIQPSWASPSQDVVLFGDGGFSPRTGATFSGQARAFGRGDEYWQHTDPISDPIAARLPPRYGFEEPTIHAAEVCGLVGSLQWRSPGAWHLFVGDRSALFHLMHKLQAQPPCNILYGCCITMESRLYHIMQELSAQWKGDALEPAWRINQRIHPEGWRIQSHPEDQRDKPKWLSKIAFQASGVVGVDIKSHQGDMQLPNAACVHGNHTQDVMCDSVRGNPRPAGVRLPSGGTFCFITRDGHMVTRAIADANRVRLREEATRKWVGRAVQGKIASCHTQLYAPTMDLRLFTACKVHTRWACLRLPSDRSDVVDLSRILYRSIRAVGGGWTEWQHSDGKWQQGGQNGNRVDSTPTSGKPTPASPRPEYAHYAHNHQALQGTLSWVAPTWLQCRLKSKQ